MSYTIEQKALVDGMYKVGKKMTEIVVAMGMPKQTVSSILMKYHAQNTIETSARSRRPKKLSEQDTRAIVRYAKKNRRATLGDITNQSVVKVSESFIRQMLRYVGLQNRVARKKPFLLQKHSKKRLDFAKTHQD